MKKDEPTLQAKVEGLEKAEIIGAMKECGWVKSKAARALGITERKLAYRIRKYGLEKEVEKQIADSKAQRFISISEEESVSVKKNRNNKYDH